MDAQTSSSRHWPGANFVDPTTSTNTKNILRRTRRLKDVQSILVDEPTANRRSPSFRASKRSETHHGVRIKDEAILSAVELSPRYITDGFLPDKAIDLIDEAASKMRRIDSKRRSTFSTAAAARDRDEAMKRRMIRKARRAEGGARGSAGGTQRPQARWNNEREMVDRIQTAKEQLERCRFGPSRPNVQANMEKWPDATDASVKQRKNSDRPRKNFKPAKMETLIEEEVTREDVAKSSPGGRGSVTRMLESEREKL